MPERRAYPLGRPNYQSGGWIADPDHIAAAKARAKQMLDAGELKPADYRRIIRRANAAAKRTKAKSNPEAVSALIRYEELHWGDQGEWDFRDVDRVPDPTKGTPVVLGELIQVVYRTVKEGDGKSDYFHDFKRKRPFLVETEDGGLAILGGDYRVEARGIVG